VVRSAGSPRLRGRAFGQGVCIGRELSLARPRAALTARIACTASKAARGWCGCGGCLGGGGADVADGWCECDGRAVGEGDYWAGVGRCKGETWAGLGNATIGRALLCSRCIREGLLA